MQSASYPTSKATRDLQRAKLSTSYSALLSEFGSSDLHSVGNYDIGHLIGKGSFGKVYLASHKLIRGSKVVLKSTRKDDANLPREIHHHRQFVHPHIARLYEVAVTEGSVWLVLEYCPGDELYHYLTKHGALDAATVQKIFAQLIGAVSYVHGKSCVHRDLKLENILLDKNGDVKLVDFGFTREYEGKASYLQTWCGTVCYSAPEMLKGEKYAGEKVDVWSLGIILYALLCGELPFDEDDDNATKMRILKEEPKYPDHLPPPAKELIVQLLSKRPLLRPSLADVLNNQWLAEYGPQQQAILKLQQPPPFSTALEAEVLHRMRLAGVNSDKVVENVTSQRCDPLAGWWALLLEKEERKEQRRERRRKAREAEGKRSRRVSAASALVLGPTIREEHEEKSPAPGLSLEHRGRDMTRADGTVVVPSPPQIVPPQHSTTEEPLRAIMSTPPSLQRRATRPMSASRRRSQLGAGIHRNNSSSLNAPLQPIFSEPTPLSPDTNSKKLKRRYMQPLASIKSWFKSNNPSKPDHTSNKITKMPQSILKPTTTITTANGTIHSPHQTPRRTHSKRLSGVNFVPEALSTSPPTTAASTNLTVTPGRPSRPALSVHTQNSTARRVSSRGSRGTSHSHSPSPITPSSPYRRTRSGHTHSRNSTSSSVSSIRSNSFGHTRGKGSSSSNASVGTSAYGSPHLSVTNGPGSRHGSRAGLQHLGIARTRSPHGSVKVLPGLPGSTTGAVGRGTTLPSGIRIALPARHGSPASSTHNPESGGPVNAFGFPVMAPGQHSPGLKPMFAKRKRSVFRGPVLGPGVASSSNSTGTRERRKSTGAGRSNSIGQRLAVTTEEDEEEEEEEEQGRGGSVASAASYGRATNDSRTGSYGHQQQRGRQSAEYEDEEDDDMEVEEVDYFSPVTDGAVEILLGGGGVDSAATMDGERCKRDDCVR